MRDFLVSLLQLFFHCYSQDVWASSPWWLDASSCARPHPADPPGRDAGLFHPRTAACTRQLYLRRMQRGHGMESITGRVNRAGIQTFWKFETCLKSRRTHHTFNRDQMAFTGKMKANPFCLLGRPEARWPFTFLLCLTHRLSPCSGTPAPTAPGPWRTCLSSGRSLVGSWWLPPAPLEPCNASYPPGRTKDSRVFINTRSLLHIVKLFNHCTATRTPNRPDREPVKATQHKTPSCKHPALLKAATCWVILQPE